MEKVSRESKKMEGKAMNYQEENWRWSAPAAWLQVIKIRVQKARTPMHKATKKAAGADYGSVAAETHYFGHELSRTSSVEAFTVQDWISEPISRRQTEWRTETREQWHVSDGIQKTKHNIHKGTSRTTAWPHVYEKSGQSWRI